MNKLSVFVVFFLVIRYHFIPNTNCIFFRHIFDSLKYLNSATMLIWILILIQIAYRKRKTIALNCKAFYRIEIHCRASTVQKILNSRYLKRKCERMNLTFDWVRLTIISRYHELTSNSTHLLQFFAELGIHSGQINQQCDIFFLLAFQTMENFWLDENQKHL